MDVQTDTELNGHNADNRKIGIDVCNPLSSNYICMIQRRRRSGISFGRPAISAGRMKNGNSV